MIKCKIEGEYLVLPEPCVDYVSRMESPVMASFGNTVKIFSGEKWGEQVGLIGRIPDETRMRALTRAILSSAVPVEMENNRIVMSHLLTSVLCGGDILAETGDGVVVLKNADHQ